MGRSLGQSYPLSSHVCGIRSRQHSWRNGKYVFGPPRSRTLCFSVPPRVRTLRFCNTIASASEQRTSFDGMPLLIRLTMSVSAKTPHLAATWWIFVGSKWSDVTISGGAFTFKKHLSIVAPVPDAHLSFIEAMAVLPTTSSFTSMAGG